MPDTKVSTSSKGISRRHVMAVAAASFAGLKIGSPNAWAADADGISHSAEAIHQEPIFKADRAHIYHVLTDAQAFDNVVRLSAAMKSMATGTKPAEISPAVGGAFSLFGGYLTGRILELVPNERIVQAWRAQSWKSGDYSIVKFDLKDHSTGAMIALDHRGFPDGLGPHLAEGWRINYWEPMEKYLLTQK